MNSGARDPVVPENEARRRLAKLSLIALGVVFGDIGTSPLYAFRECFHGDYGFPVPLTIVVLAGLFLIQRNGTAQVGSLFGPIIWVWFAVSAVLGGARILHQPSVLAAILPWHAIRVSS